MTVVITIEIPLGLPVIYPVLSAQILSQGATEFGSFSY